MSERTVRYHLKKLKDDNIVSNCRKGNVRLYHIRTG
jgi:predicted transcriptional regulator